jgi:hypothetical protein
MFDCGLIAAAANFLARIVLAVAVLVTIAAGTERPPNASLQEAVDWKAFLIGTKAKPGDHQRLPLGALPVQDLSDVKILLGDHFVKIDQHYTLRVNPPLKSRLSGCPIMVVPIPGESNAEAATVPLPADYESKPIAELVFEQGQLFLAPTSLSTTRIAAQLCNADLLFQYPGGSQLIRLRTVTSKPSIQLNLAQEGTIVRLPTAPLPSVGRTFLEVSRIAGEGHEFYPIAGEKRVEIDDTISFSLKGEITTLLDVAYRTDRDGHFARIKAYYQIGDQRRRSFVAMEVMKAGKSAEQAIANAQNQLAAARSALPQIENELNGLAGSSGGDDRAQGERAAKIEYLTRLRRKAISTIRRFERSLPRSLAALEHLKRVRDLGQQLHKKVNVEFSVEVMYEGRRLALAEYKAPQ